MLDHILGGYNDDDDDDDDDDADDVDDDGDDEDGKEEKTDEDADDDDDDAVGRVRKGDPGCNVAVERASSSEGREKRDTNRSVMSIA